MLCGRRGKRWRTKIWVKNVVFWWNSSSPRLPVDAHCQSLQSSHYSIWAHWQVKIFSLLDIWQTSEKTWRVILILLLVFHTYRSSANLPVPISCRFPLICVELQNLSGRKKELGLKSSSVNSAKDWLDWLDYLISKPPCPSTRTREKL